MSLITEQTSRLVSILQDKIPEQKTGLAPADAFFTRKVAVPKDLNHSDRIAFIQLFLEGNAPFPMEQLAWGYFFSDKSDFAFVYATPKSRLKRLGVEKVQSYFQLFPGFISLYGEVLDEPTVRFISQNGILSAIYQLPGNPVPEKVVSRKIQAELLTDELLIAAREDFAARLQLEGYACEAGLWLGQEIRILADGRTEFIHRHIGDGASLGLKAHVLTLDEQGLWAADLRDPAYAEKEKAIRQRSSLIWKSLRFAGWAALLMLALQLLNFLLGGVNLWQANTIRRIEPLATRVENKLTLAERLTQSTEEDLKPFLLMEAINPLRPDSIFFNKVRSRAFNELEIEGQSSEGVTPVNAFADSINQLSFVNSVENNSQTRNNQTSFEFLITFSEPPPEPEGGFIIPDESEEPGETEEEKG
jgi:hypothetical protein